MPKINIEYIKKNPGMFAVIFVVFGVLLWVLMNRNPGGSNPVVVSGAAPPSEAAIMAGAQIQMAQLQAGAAVQSGQLQLAALQAGAEAQYDLAQLELAYSLAELGVNERISDKTLEASLAALTIQSDTQLGMVAANNDFMIGYARVAADSATNQVLINAALQRDLGAQSLEAYLAGIDASKYNATLSAIGSLKKKDRDNALAGVVGYAIPNDPKRSGGSSFLGSLAGFMASPVAALAS